MFLYNKWLKDGIFIPMEGICSKGFGTLLGVLIVEFWVIYSRVNFGDWSIPMETFFGIPIRQIPAKIVQKLRYIAVCAGTEKYRKSLVRKTGLEPAHLAALEPKSTAHIQSIPLPVRFMLDSLIIIRQNPANRSWALSCGKRSKKAYTKKVCTHFESAWW